MTKKQAKRLKIIFVIIAAGSMVAASVIQAVIMLLTLF
jgi:hypothetical protein